MHTSLKLLLVKFKDKMYYEFIHVTMSYKAQAMY